MAVSFSDILSLIETVVNVYEHVKSNKKQIGEILVEKIRKIEPYIKDLQLKNKGNLSVEVTRDLRGFHDLLNQIRIFITKFTDLSYIMKAWKRNKHTETIVEFNKSLDEYITRMQFGIVCSSADHQIKLFQCIEMDKIELHEILANNHDLMEANHWEVLETLQEQIKEIKLMNKAILEMNASKRLVLP